MDKWSLGDGDECFVAVSRVRFVFIEIGQRVGKIEGARRLGYSRQAFLKIVNPNSGKKFVRRRTAREAMLLLRDLREQGVRLSEGAIARGAIARGELTRT